MARPISPGLAGLSGTRSTSTSCAIWRSVWASLVASISAPPWKNETWESTSATRIGRAGRTMRRIIVDCTHTFHTGAGTGIQRVVREYADALLALAGEAQLEVVPARIEHGRFVALPVTAGRVAFPRAASARESESAPAAAPDALMRALGWAGAALHRLMPSEA